MSKKVKAKVIPFRQRKDSAVKQELLALKDKAGRIKPQSVVSYAQQHPESALYKRFDWDKKRCVERDLLHQAREIINAEITIIRHVPTQSFVSLRVDRAIKGGGYRQIESILDSASLANEMLNDAYAEMEHFISKYRHLSALAGVVEEMERAMAKRRKRA